VVHGLEDEEVGALRRDADVPPHLGVVRGVAVLGHGDVDAVAVDPCRPPQVLADARLPGTVVGELPVGERPDGPRDGQRVAGGRRVGRVVAERQRDPLADAVGRLPGVALAATLNSRSKPWSAPRSRNPPMGLFVSCLNPPTSARGGGVPEPSTTRVFDVSSVGPRREGECPAGA
jgi:hypothetical protein